MANDNFFSRAALDKLRTPEKLDALLPVTTPLGWMGLVCVGLLIVSVVIWSVFGAFTTRVDGMGLIMDSGGFANVVHPVEGEITKIYVREGMSVKKGALIARMEQTDQSANTQIAQYETELAKNMSESMKKAHEYKAKNYRRELSRDVVSDYDGKIDKVLVREGTIVERGAPICSVRLTGKRSDLSGVLYVPADKGKLIKPGQTVQLAPGGVNADEAGSLVGVVRSVSEYPVSLQSVEGQLGSPELAKWIMEKEGTIVEISFGLIKDEKSTSGYLWTTSTGTHKPVTAGSFCKGSVIVEREPPIEKVFNRIGQWLRIR